MACVAGEAKEGFIVDIIILGIVQKDKADLTEHFPSSDSTHVLLEW